MEKFWMMDPAKARISIMGEIGIEDSFFESYETTLKSFKEDMKQFEGAKEITVVIDSPGGSLYAGRSIYSALKESGAKIDVQLLSEASSAASLIMCAGDTITARPHTMALIHRCHCFFPGSMDANELARELKSMEAFDRNAAEIYAQRSRKCSAEEFLAMMDESSHLTAKELMEIGLVDSILEGQSKNDALLRAEFKRRNDSMTDTEKKRCEAAEEELPPKKPEEDEPAMADDLAEENADLREENAKLRAQIEELQAKIDELTGDQKRIEEIDRNASLFSDQAMLFKAKYEDRLTMEQLAVKQLQMQANDSKAYANSRLADLSESGVNDVPAAGITEPMMSDKEESDSEKAAKLFKDAFKNINQMRGK